MTPAMLTTATRAAIVAFAAVLYSTSLVVLVKKVHSFKAIESWLPGTWEKYYTWHATDGGWTYYYLEYDYSIDNFTWVAAGISVVAASLVLAAELVALIRSWGQGGQSAQSLKRHSVVTYGLGFFSVAAFVASVFASIFSKVRFDQVYDRCHWTILNWNSEVPQGPRQAPDSSHLCTHEMVVCDVGPRLDTSSNPSYLCDDEQLSRHMLPVFAVFAGLMTITWVVQMWVAKKQTPAYDADERVRRLEEEDEA